MYNFIFNCGTESFSPLFEYLVWFMADLGQCLSKDSHKNCGFPELTCSVLRNMTLKKNKACSLLAHKLRDSGGHAQRAQAFRRYKETKEIKKNGHDIYNDHKMWVDPTGAGRKYGWLLQVVSPVLLGDCRYILCGNDKTFTLKTAHIAFRSYEWWNPCFESVICDYCLFCVYYLWLIAVAASV